MLGDICQHKVKFVLTFATSDQTLVEISTVALYLHILIRSNWICTNQPQECTEFHALPCLYVRVFYGTHIDRYTTLRTLMGKQDFRPPVLAILTTDRQNLIVS